MALASGLATDISGDGFPLVMVHGLGGTSNSFQSLIPVLGDYKVIRLDLPGSGRSALPGDPLSVEIFVAAIIACLKTLGVARAHFAGHSLGTIICQHLAVEHPGCVASLTLFGAITEPPDTARAALHERARRVRNEGMTGVADLVAANTLSTATHAAKPEAAGFVRESLMRQDPEAYARTCEALAKAKAADWTRIAAPTLIITGETDPTAPVSMGQMLADRIKGATFSTLDRCGHWATIENPQESGRRMREFLQRQRHREYAPA